MTDTIEYKAPAEVIASKLTGATISYLPQGKSTIKPDGPRIFKIISIYSISFSKKGGRRFVTALCKDIDDRGEAKYRSLHLAGIEFAV